MATAHPNRQEARLILAAYRANGADATDPRLAEALALARSDPELAAWFARQQAFDSAAVSKLNSIAPPRELRDAISAGLRFQRPRQNGRWLFAAAAALVVGVAVIFGRWWSSRGSFNDAGLVMFATNYVANGFTLQARSARTADLLHWLAVHHAPLPERLPLDSSELHSLGCRTLSFQGRTVTLICFEHGREFHLFVARRADFPRVRVGTKARSSSTANGWSAAEWMDADHVYVLVSDATPRELQRQLAGSVKRSA